MNFKSIALFFIFAASTLTGFTLKAQTTGQAGKISYADFTVTAGENKINVNWTIRDTAGANYFELQKSRDGVNFQTVALILGADPKIPGGKCYGCPDKMIKSYEHLYYRLKHVNSEGKEEISETKQLAVL